MPMFFQGNRCVAEKVRENCKLLETKGSLQILEVKLKEDPDLCINGCKRFIFGAESIKKNRTIMVMGGTGAGKSTLINAIFNYILGVEWDYPYRFKIVTEDQSISQIHSQTSEVMVYQINHQDGFRIDYSLTMIDTPGYGDARGLERDQETTQQIRNLFSEKSGVTDIHVICFVAQASLARLTPAQRYVFDSVLSIFGNDVKENIKILITFSDGTQPLVLDAIEAAQVPCTKAENGLPAHFQFNNSTVFTPIKAGKGFDKLFWDMGIESMQSFFCELQKNNPKSLTLTKEVLKERQHLENLVENLQIQVEMGLKKLDAINKNKDKIKEHEAEISRNKDFEIDVSYIEPKQIGISGSGVYITNCQDCRHTCHFPCSIPDDRGKHGCAAMISDGTCAVCPGKCHWTKHFNQKYRWEYEHVIKKQTIEDLRKKYLSASNKKKPVEALILKLEKDYEKQKEDVNDVVMQATKALNRLKVIALKPNTFTAIEYIKLLIETEKNEHKPGWDKRVKALNEVMKRTETLEKLAQGKALLS